MRLGTTTRRLDTEAVEQGVEKECPHRPGLFVRVLPAASWNQRFKERVRRENEAVVQRMKENGDPGKVDYYDDAEFIADTVVAGMRGLYDDEGNEVEYTPELGAQILADPYNADVKEWVVLQAKQYGRYYREEVEKDAGN